MPDREPKIYLLPNLMTAGNLFCGFSAVLRIFEGMLAPPGEEVQYYYHAIWFILGACIFDLLDGRVARLVGTESEFGREFDSIADIVSFGMAPALLVFDIVLASIPEGYGYLIAFVYLLCGAMRLARFNCVSNLPKEAESGKGGGDFVGVPIPAAAGLIASITLFLLHSFGGGEGLGKLRHGLWVLMLLLSYLMFSKIRFPSFKALNWRTKRSIPWVFAVVILIVFTVRNYWFMPAVIFLAYIGYGLGRPWISRRWRRQIEIEIGAEAEPEGEAEGEAEVDIGTEEGAATEDSRRA
ncbi:CDP-diacylglycerol--serine O-phosphatidyltransferase [soil metagenome]